MLKLQVYFLALLIFFNNFIYDCLFPELKGITLNLLNGWISLSSFHSTDNLFLRVNLYLLFNLKSKEMKSKQNLISLFLLFALLMGLSSCQEECCYKTKVIPIYENSTIPANTGISTGVYTKVDGYQFVNVFVEFQQDSAFENPLSLGVAFALDSIGKLSAETYFNFEQNFEPPADPQIIILSGENSWRGYPENKSSYIARLPVMGPYLQVFPYNHHYQSRRLSVVLYLTQ